MASTTAHDKLDVDGPSAGQMPIVLARLPRVGASAEPTPSPDAAAPPAPHTTAPLPPPEHLPQLDLRDEIHQRMHIADLPHEGPSAPMGRRYSADPKPQAEEPTQEKASTANKTQVKQRRDSPRQSRTTTAQQPKGLSETVYQLHGQLAPYAGLIVTLALIASAGLLYWMIVGPTQPTLPELDMPIYQLEQGHLGSDEPLVPEFYLEPTQPSPPATSTSRFTEAEEPVFAMPVPPVSAPQPVEVQIEPAVIQELPATEEPQLHFPTTGRPDPLDFTKLSSPAGASSQPAVPQPQQLPAVARQPQGIQIR